MKRFNENSQLTSDEVEELNDAAPSVGGKFVRAPPEELAKRRMIKLSRPAESGNTAAWSSKNAFAGFVMPQPTTGSFPEATRSNEILFGRPAESNNTAAWSSKSAFAGFVMPQPATGSFPESIRSNEILLGNRMKPAPSTESDFVVKMKKLNSSVLSWMNRQIIDQPLSIWKDGLKDYVRYSTEISEKYGSTELSTTASANLIEMSKAPTGNSFGMISATSGSFMKEVAAPTVKPLLNFSVPAVNFGAPAVNFGAPAVNFGTPVAGFEAARVDGDEEEGEPILEAEKALRNEDDKDDILCDCPCKLLRFDGGKGDGGKGEWTDVGKGNFRITKCPETQKQRMLVRNTVGRITFNAAFYKGMKVTRYSKVMLSFGVVIDPSGPLRNFLLKLKDTDIDSVCSIMEAAIKVYNV